MRQPCGALAYAPGLQVLSRIERVFTRMGDSAALPTAVRQVVKSPRSSYTPQMCRAPLVEPPSWWLPRHKRPRTPTGVRGLLIPPVTCSFTVIV